MFNRTTNGGWNEIEASIADNSGNRTTIWVRFVYVSSGTVGPVDSIGRRPLRSFAKSDQGDCAAFGAFQCEGVVLTQTIPGFVTRDRSRDLHLVYNSSTQRARTILPIELRIAGAKKAPAANPISTPS